jgi:hypothetical protein
MCQTGKLFRVELTGQQVWDLYLKSFTKENDPIFRDPESSTHNCNHCKNFVRRYGNVVAVDEHFNIVTMFDVEADEEYLASMKAESEELRTKAERKAFEQKILGLIAEKQEDSLKGKSIEELEAMLK